jgi:hypothetical protein
MSGYSTMDDEDRLYMSVCETCGSAVADQRLHDRFHAEVKSNG